MEKPIFILLSWDDAWVDGTATVTLKDVGETHKPEVIETAGWLLKADDMGVSLANERCADGSYRGRTFVPKAMVRKITYCDLIKPRKPRAKKTIPPTDNLGTPASAES